VYVFHTFWIVVSFVLLHCQKTPKLTDLQVVKYCGHFSVNAISVIITIILS